MILGKEKPDQIERPKTEEFQQYNLYESWSEPSLGLFSIEIVSVAVICHVINCRIVRTYLSSPLPNMPFWWFYWELVFPIIIIYWIIALDLYEYNSKLIVYLHVNRDELSDFLKE